MRVSNANDLHLEKDGKEMKKYLRILLLLSLAVFLLVGCGQTNQKENGHKPVVAVTIVPQKTFVEAVCGDTVEVVTLVPPGNSPSNYEPTPIEIEAFNRAVVYFSIGVPTEEANILPNARSINVLSLDQAVATVYPDRNFDGLGRDPHIWLSPKRVQVMVKTIEEEMSRLYPDNQALYQANAENYRQALDDLDQEIKRALEGVENKTFIAYHPAFGYLADDYGLEMIALEEEGKEARPQQLQKIIDLAKEKGIKVIFYQEEIDSSQSQAFAEEIGGKTIQLAPLAPDYINNLKKMANTMAEVME